MSLQFAREDYKEIVGNGEFSTPVTFTTPGINPFSASIIGLFVEHHNQVNTDGVPVNAKVSRLTICESDLTAKGYTTRNAANKVSLSNHLVSLKDINNVQRSYIVAEILPDNGIGGITLILANND